MNTSALLLTFWSCPASNGPVPFTSGDFWDLTLPAMDFLWWASLPITTLLLTASHLYQHFLISCLLHFGYFFFSFTHSIQSINKTRVVHGFSLSILKLWLKELIIIIFRLLPNFFLPVCTLIFWWFGNTALLEHQVCANSGHKHCSPASHWIAIQGSFFVFFFFTSFIITKSKRIYLVPHTK